MAKKTQKEKDQKFYISLVKQLLTLSTAGFGLAAALAWNSLIQDVLKVYLKPWLGNGVLVSGLVYAIIVTFIAVLVTLQLSKILRRLEEDNDNDEG